MKLAKGQKQEMVKKLNDERYLISLEYCGFNSKHFVLRFCDDFISSHKTEQAAYFKAIQHKDEYYR